ncbi:carbon-nitrogen hydrolase family protein [Rhodococcus sp. UNC363MFTsu5.1]|uniref:carbon-nitrogen hydrolase family protein n=1 Tax=Rhodococcus sp. UNC363MFTsu5.1 TaxID=1449069 RepID=UPI00068CF9CE|nr:carbon-nitrogen hydrolase family protein [Rhodococcus sp. UNC363MFTsu5.1]
MGGRQRPSAGLNIRVAVAQPTTVLGDLSGNVAAHAAAVDSAAADLVVFPEMSLSGYAMDAQAVDPEDPRLLPLMAACRRTGAIALAGAPVHTGGGGRGIGVLAVSGVGVTVAYIKMSLAEEEARHFEPGRGPASLEVRGLRVGIGVCKDTRIDHHLDRTAALGIDLYVAGLVHAPDELAEFDVRARRIATAYDLPVAFAGFAGPTGGGFARTCGGSGVWDCAGTVVRQLGSEPGAVASVEL